MHKTVTLIFFFLKKEEGWVPGGGDQYSNQGLEVLNFKRSYRKALVTLVQLL